MKKNNLLGKALVLVGLSVGLVLEAPAQNWRNVNFLAPVSGIILSNNLGYSNLLSQPIVTSISTTNIVGLQWTNAFGVQVVAAAGDATQLSVDVPLWMDRNGNMPIYTVPATSTTNTAISTLMSALELNIHILTAGASANSAVNFTFTPIYDGTHEATAAADAWTVGITSAGATQVNLSTNVPLWRWPGAKSLRLRTATNTDTDSASQVYVDNVSISGFVP